MKKPNGIRALELLHKLVNKNKKLSSYKKGILIGEIRLSGCTVCGSRNSLNIHHLNYIEGTTLLLCRNCHKRVHFGKGLEHLNPIGKRQWMESTIKLERIEEIEVPDVKEALYYRGYALLFKAIMFKKKEIWPRLIEEMGYLRRDSTDIINTSLAHENKYELKNVTIYTDGSCLGNPGQGGYAAILEYGKYTKEISGGYKMTTNNRMEIMAAIAGLEVLKDVCKVTLWSDSEYLVKAMNEGWVRRWKDYNWKLSNNKRATNIDLWDRLLKICEIHDVVFEWIKGHNINLKNERCDELANKAAQNDNLHIDYGYKRKATTRKLL